MPDDFEPEVFNTYVYDPERNAYYGGGYTREQPASLEELTDGKFFQRGPNLYRTGDSAYVGRVAYSRGATVEVGSQGSVLLNNRVERSRVDDPMAPDRQPRLVITGDITHLGDTQENPINRVISLAPRGELVYVKDDVPSGRERYSRQLAPAPGEPVPQRLVTGWRLATADEMVLRGVAGYLSRNAFAALDALKREGVERPDGTVTRNGSEIVRILAARLDVEPVITYALGERE